MYSVTARASAWFARLRCTAILVFVTLRSVKLLDSPPCSRWLLPDLAAFCRLLCGGESAGQSFDEMCVPSRPDTVAARSGGAVVGETGSEGRGEPTDCARSRCSRRLKYRSHAISMVSTANLQLVGGTGVVCEWECIQYKCESGYTHVHPHLKTE